MKSTIIFADEKIKQTLQKLKESTTEDKKVYEWLLRAFVDLEKDAFSGVQIPKRLIPKEYQKKFGKLDNLWKYNLPDAWRLIYSIENQEILVVSIVLDWMDHKAYEKKFNY